MNEVIKLIRSMVGERFEVTPEILARLAFTLGPVVLDLADGDQHISPENRLRLQEAVMVLRHEVQS